MSALETLQIAGPLDGLRVLDLSRVLAGPLCTMTLGDLGANVLKIERLGTGDESRGWGPPFDSRGESAYYLSANRNKLSAALDFGADADIVLLRELALSADIVVENFRPGALERKGFGATALLSLEPRLIWCTISGFGEASDRPGYDFVVQAEAGWMAITGEPDGSPMKVGVALADVIAGKDAAIAILAALAARERGTLGEDVEARHITISLLHSATAALVNVAQNVLVSGREAGRWGNAHANLCPYQLFETSDVPIVIAVGSDAQWLACARALDLPELAEDQALATNTGRLQNRGQVVGAISERLRGRDARAWVAALDNVGVPCGIVKNVTEALEAVDASPLTGVHPLSPRGVRYAPPRLNEQGDLVRIHRWNAFAKVKPLAARMSEH